MHQRLSPVVPLPGVNGHHWINKNNTTCATVKKKQILIIRLNSMREQNPLMRWYSTDG